MHPYILLAVVDDVFMGTHYCLVASLCHPQVVYEDGDTEDLNRGELEPVLVEVEVKEKGK